MNRYIINDLENFAEGMTLMTLLNVDIQGKRNLRQNLYEKESDNLYVSCGPGSPCSIFCFRIHKHPLVWLNAIKRNLNINKSFGSGSGYYDISFQKECLLARQFDVASFLNNYNLSNDLFDIYYYNNTVGSRIKERTSRSLLPKDF
jgi:hypothetical protein